MTVQPGMPFTSAWAESHAISPDEAAQRYQAQADSLGGKFEDLFGAGHAAAAASARTAADRQYEQYATQSARAWDEYMQSTQYQRMVKDLEAAGLNPWLALQGGSLGNYSQTTAGSGSSARYKSEEEHGNLNLSSIALLLVACARLFVSLKSGNASGAVNSSKSVMRFNRFR